MSSSVSVLCPNGRRVNVTLGPNTPLHSIKQQACEKQEFDPSQYGMRKEDMKKALDLSLPFRLSGLPNKAKLELFEDSTIQKSVQVNIALQLDTGGRVMGQIANNSTISQVIQTIGKDVGSVSSVMYLQRKINKEEFNTVTLLDLGVFKGSAMLRLQGVQLKSAQIESAVKPEVIPEPSMETEEEEETKMTCTESVEERVEEKSTVSEMEVEETSGESVISTDVVEKEKKEEIVERKKSVEIVPLLFDPSSQISVSKMDESDDFFEVTDRDLKAMLRDLHKISEREFRFREPEKEKELPDHVVFRFRLPNGLMLQNIFETKCSTTDSLYSFVSNYLTEPSSTQLALYQAPPKRVIKPGQSLEQAGLTSTTLLHAGGDIVLRADLKVESDAAGAVEQLCSVVGKPDIVSTQCDKEVTVPVTVARTEQQSSSQSVNRNKDGKAVPKWFKLK